MSEIRVFSLCWRSHVEKIKIPRDSFILKINSSHTLSFHKKKKKKSIHQLYFFSYKIITMEKCMCLWITSTEEIKAWERIPKIQFTIWFSFVSFPIGFEIKFMLWYVISMSIYIYTCKYTQIWKLIYNDLLKKIFNMMVLTFFFDIFLYFGYNILSLSLFFFEENS